MKPIIAVTCEIVGNERRYTAYVKNGRLRVPVYTETAPKGQAAQFAADLAQHDLDYKAHVKLLRELSDV